MACLFHKRRQKDISQHLYITRTPNVFKVLYGMTCTRLDITSIKEYPEKYSWWLNELESLGLVVKKANDINDITEVSSLTDSIKQVMFQDYKTCYNEETEEGIVV
jgi:hypothetical protein